MLRVLELLLILEGYVDFEFEVAPPPAPPKSTFVTVLAWIFIVLGGFSTFVTLLQNIMIRTLMKQVPFDKLRHNMEQTEQVPAMARWFFSHFDLFFLCVFIVSLILLVSAIGLLKRWNWARWLFILMMLSGICWNLFGLLMQLDLLAAMPEFTGGQPLPAEFATMMGVMKVATFGMTFAFSGLFVFIIYKLSTKKIRREFCSFRHG